MSDIYSTFPVLGMNIISDNITKYIRKNIKLKFITGYINSALTTIYYLWF
jgi:hypothetical protein